MHAVSDIQAFVFWKPVSRGPILLPFQGGSSNDTSVTACHKQGMRSYTQSRKSWTGLLGTLVLRVNWLRTRNTSLLGPSLRHSLRRAWFPPNDLHPPFGPAYLRPALRTTPMPTRKPCPQKRKVRSCKESSISRAWRKERLPTSRRGTVARPTTTRPVSRP